jgi:hypothetical protein
VTQAFAFNPFSSAGFALANAARSRRLWAEETIKHTTRKAPTKSRKAHGLHVLINGAIADAASIVKKEKVLAKSMMASARLQTRGIVIVCCCQHVTGTLLSRNIMDDGHISRKGESSRQQGTPQISCQNFSQIQSNFLVLAHVVLDHSHVTQPCGSNGHHATHG